MANKLKIEAEVENLGKIYRLDAPFDESLATLRRNGIKHLIPPRDLAYARMQAGKQSSLCSDGSYTNAGFVYAQKSYPVLVLNSLLLNVRLAKKATQASRESRYFSTQDARIYEQCLKLAEKEAAKEPEKRKAIILPSTGNFRISMKEKPEVMRAVFKDVAQEYLTFLGQDSIPVSLVNKDIVNANAGTTLTQLWLRRLGGESGLDGDDRYLDCILAVRGVLSSEARSAEAAPKKFEEAYTPEQITAALMSASRGLETRVLTALRANN
jgi:hypothetical protein